MLEPLCIWKRVYLTSTSFRRVFNYLRKKFIWKYITVIKRRLILLVTGLHARVHRANVLTIENYAGVGHPHGVCGDAGVVSVVAFRDVEENEHRLFALILDLNAVQSVEEPEGEKTLVLCACTVWTMQLWVQTNLPSLLLLTLLSHRRCKSYILLASYVFFFLLLLLFSRNDFSCCGLKFNAIAIVRDHCTVEPSLCSQQLTQLWGST